MIYKAIQYIKNKKTLLQTISIILCFTFILSACLGCTSYASSEAVDGVSAELETVTTELNSIKESYEAAQKEIEALKNAANEAKKELASAKSSTEAAQQEINTLMNANKALQDILNALTEDNKALQAEIDALKNTDNPFQDEIASLKATNEALQNEINALTQSNSSTIQELEALKSNISTMQDEINSLKADKESALQEIEKLKEQIQELQNSNPPEEPIEKIKIYIDQGHNPSNHHNSGASGNGLYEEDLTFLIGKLLAGLLENDGRFETCLSRPTASTILGTDNSSSLNARIDGANDFGADYFISLHINSHTDNAANGIEVYTVEESGISYDFGNSLLKGLIKSTGLNNRGMKQSTSLRVLNNATMPATLLEMGFISNSGDAELLSEHPEYFANGIYKGILNYFGMIPNNTP